jgi:hypothetical protein
MKILNSTFDFKDRVNSSLGRETRKEWSKRKFNENFNYLRGLNSSGLNDVLDLIIDNWNSGFYEKLLLAYVSREENHRDFTFDEMSNNRLFVLAGENLPKTGLKTIAFSKTDLNVFKTMPLLLITIYFMNIGRPLYWEDALNEYFSGLDARLMFGLDKFDELEEVPQPTAEFFQKLGETQIASKATSDLYMKLTLLQMHIEDDIFGHNFGDFSEDYRPTEDLFIQLLAGCSAVHNGRETINSDDVIMAYKTFLKLIKTDITVYKAPQSIIDSMHEFTGALVCDKCVVSHGMGPEDSPDDFENTCECGGHLIYKKEI